MPAGPGPTLTGSLSRDRSIRPYRPARRLHLHTYRVATSCPSVSAASWSPWCEGGRRAADGHSRSAAPGRCGRWPWDWEAHPIQGDAAGTGRCSTRYVRPGMDSAGTYRYIVTVPPPCLNDTAEVLVNVIPAPDPGGSGQLVLCANAGTEDLFQALAGAPMVVVRGPMAVP